MSLSSEAGAAAGPDVRPGTVPAWAVVFFEERTSRPLATIGSDTYNGSVTANLPADLTGGVYQVVVEGMTDDHYRRIHNADIRGPVAAVIHLWWQDSPTGVLGDLARFTGLDHPLAAISPDPPPLSQVAVIRVERLWRRPGARRFEVVVDGRELVVARLSDAQAAPVPRPDLPTAIQVIADDAGVDVRQYGLAGLTTSDGSASTAVPVMQGTALQALNGVLESTARPLLRRYGQPLAVIRDGVLHVGDWANDGATRLPVLRGIDDDSGLLGIERGALRRREPAAGDGAPSARLTLAVTALGRPDLKPGDTLAVELPPEDFPKVDPPSVGAALLAPLTRRPFGDLGPDPTTDFCRVTEVSHRVSREQGFVTVVKAFVLAGGEDDGWDLGGGPAEVRDVRATPPIGEPHADSAQAFSTRFRGVIDNHLAGLAGRARSRVGVVHDHAAGVENDALPRHTSEIWYATAPPDGFIGVARRAEITPDRHGEARQVPYVTPVAWGNFGLVLPRYPATRVLLVDGGAPEQYVDAGALWAKDAGRESEAGDYWLALPVNVPQPEHLESAGEPPTEANQRPADGPATHDLTDRSGTRVIETARFVVRVTDDLTKVPARPDVDAGPPGSVLIETRPASGPPARMLLDADGGVTVTGASITFDAGQGDITFKAKDVNVKLAGGTMDVS